MAEQDQDDAHVGAIVPKICSKFVAQILHHHQPASRSSRTAQRPTVR
jgi:hypothetical protein